MHIERWVNLSSVKSLFASLIANNQPIEELQITCVDDELCKMIQQMRTIKSLYIGKTAPEFAIDIAKNLPNLEYLFHSACYYLENQLSNISVVANLLLLCPVKLTKIDTNEIVMYREIDEAL